MNFQAGDRVRVIGSYQNGREGVLKRLNVGRVGGFYYSKVKLDTGGYDHFYNKSLEIIDEDVEPEDWS